MFTPKHSRENSSPQSIVIQHSYLLLWTFPSNASYYSRAEGVISRGAQVLQRLNTTSLTTYNCVLGMSFSTKEVQLLYSNAFPFHTVYSASSSFGPFFHSMDSTSIESHG